LDKAVKITLELDPQSTIGRTILGLLASGSIPPTPPSTPERSTSDGAFIAFLRSRGGQARHSEIRNHMRGMVPGYQATKRRLLNAGVIERVDRGVYRLVERVSAE
jgi:hypothetical protein